MDLFVALADPTRRRIIESLATGERSFGELAEQFEMSRPAVSQHLKVLRDSGFAHVTVSGARRIYAIDATPLDEVDRWLSQFRRFWGPKLEALATEVARGKRKRKRRSGTTE